MPSAPSGASILHLDLDAFFAAVEQRDKPSLRGKPVIVGGTGMRGVVSTASYEARRFGARSAMPTAEARRRCPPGTAFLGGRFDAYRASSRVVMDLLREYSPVVEQVSIDEAFVDLTAASQSQDPDDLQALGDEIRAEISRRTGGLTAAVGIGTSKMIAKLGSEADKPGGLTVVAPGEEMKFLAPLPVRAIPGVGPATGARMQTFGVETVADLAAVSLTDLIAIFGQSHGSGLYRLARADDTRTVVAEREAKSLSVEETFESDLTDRAVLGAELEALTRRLVARLGRAALFARTVTVKVRRHDYTALTRSATLNHATGDAVLIQREAERLLAGVDVTEGLRLLGVGVSGLTDHAQAMLLDDLLPGLSTVIASGADQPAAFPDVRDDSTGTDPALSEEAVDLDHGAGAAGLPYLERRGSGWRTGQDVVHADHGAGWVWGAGLGRVTVRFEGPRTAPGPVRTFAVDDPDLQHADPPDWRDPDENGASATA